MFVSMCPSPLWDRRPFSCPWVPSESVTFLTSERVTGTASIGRSRIGRKYITHLLQDSEWIRYLFSVLCKKLFQTCRNIFGSITSLTGLVGGR